ncbi:MAG: hypothetical protein HYX63_12190 [Gammaproteobacteria bacterium]|nr:hypothetical protein [Gammaproteobacteria bacterium]
MLLKNGLECERLFAFNEFTFDIEKLVHPSWDAPAGPWTDFDDLAARLRLGSLHGVDFKTETVSDAALLLAYGAKYHPVRDYLNGFMWDGKARINLWLEYYMGAVTYLDHETLRYLGAVGSMWPIGAVARIFQPGCKMDNALILEGVQDIGKSTALKTLAQPWLVDTPFNIGDKDAFLMMRGK